jgi:hypothetical protein
LENRKKAIINSLRNVHKRKNKVEEGEVLSLRVKKEHESSKPRAQKMMRGRLEPSTMPLVVHATKQTAKVAQMTSPQER